MTRADKPLALTLGDPAGIGPDITLLAFEERFRAPIPPFVLLGDPDVLGERARALGLGVKIKTIGDASAALPVFDIALPVLPIAVAASVVAGHPDPANAAIVQQSIERSVTLVQSEAASAVVTNPISKAILARAGFGFPGHTEFLAALAGREASDAVMMLAGGDLKVVPVTIHLPLKDVIGALSTERILKTLEITARDVARYFGLARPRIAVTGLNPHAGEDGTMGREEIETIVPAIAAARRQGLDVTGPYPCVRHFRLMRHGCLRPAVYHAGGNRSSVGHCRQRKK